MRGIRCLAALLLVLLLAGCIGAGAESFPAYFISTKENRPVDLTVTLEDEWFLQPSDSYRHDIARASLAMAMAAFRDTKAELAESDLPIRSFLTAAGFTGYRAYQYDREPTGDTVANAIAWKELSDENGSYVLLAVPVCGQGYGDEWLSNFDVGDGIEHVGFAASADAVYERVLGYVRENGFSERRVKVWVVGFSRAAAVSNILGERLLVGGRFEPNDIFVYGFATPNTTRRPVAYPQIYSICGGEDPVPKIPMAEWGYAKYGITLRLPTREATMEYDRLAEPVEACYRALMGADGSSAADPNRNWLVEKLLEIMAVVMPDSATYTEYYLDGIRNAWCTEGSVVDRLQALMDTLEAESPQKDTEAEQPVDDRTAALRTIAVTELKEVIATAALQTADQVSAMATDTTWPDLLQSGMQIANEHFPEVYYAWLASTDDTSRLFPENRESFRISVMGDVTVELRCGDETVYATDNDTGRISHVQLGKKSYFTLPADRAWSVTLTANGTTDTQFSYRLRNQTEVSFPMYLCRPITLYKGESISVELQPGELPTAMLTGTKLPILLYEAGENPDVRDVMSSAEDTGFYLFLSTLFATVGVVLYILMGLLVLIYMLVVLIRRLVRGKRDDITTYTTVGSRLLMAATVMAGVMTAAYIYNLLGSILDYSTLRPVDPTMHRIVQYIGFGRYGYLAGSVLLYLLQTILCVRAVRHRVSRTRLRNLTIQLVLVSLSLLLIGADIRTTGITAILSLILPITVFIGLRRIDPDRKGRKKESAKA